VFDDQSSDRTQPAGKSPDFADHAAQEARHADAPPSSSASNDAGESSSKYSENSQKTVISKRPPASAPVFQRAASPLEMGQMLEGEQLGHYQLEEFIGGGGMGAVFRANDTMLGRTVAVKVVSRDQTNDETLKRFRNEAQSAARLDHPNIARVYYVGEDKGWNYIVFEYIEGINVRDLVERDGPLSLENALSYTLQITEALHHASNRDVVHRDIKPSNILIMEDGHAKLVDMGLARLHHVESGTNDLTASGVTLGTFDYISPEQARDPRDTDVRGDLYSLGCTLYFMLTGQPPFADGTVLQKLLSHSSEEPPDPALLRPDLPEEVAAVINKLLAKLPSQRYQSPAELIAELLLLADQLELPNIRTRSAVWITTGESAPSLIPRHLPWVVSVSALFIVFLVVHLIGRLQGPVEMPEPLLDQKRVSMSGSESPQITGPNREVVPTAEAEGDAVPGAADGSDSVSSAGQDSLPDTSTAAPGGMERADSASSVDRNPFEARPIADAEIAENEGGEPVSSQLDPAADNGPALVPALGPALGSAQSAAVDAASAAVGRSDESLANEPPGTPAAEATIGREELLVVADDLSQVRPNEEHVATLNEALQIAAGRDSIRVIELRFAGAKRFQAFSVDLGDMSERELIIRGLPNSATIIHFQARDDDVFRELRPAMIYLQGGHLKWEDVHFLMDLNQLKQPQENYSLFRLRESVNVDFHRCTFTIRNRPLVEGRRQDASFFDMYDESLLLGEFEAPSLSANAPTPSIWMEQCIARGQATLLRSERAIPFLLSWNHGLFISTERLIEIGGTFIEPRWEHGRAVLFCQRLISVADEGICLMMSDSRAPFQVGLAANCYDCLFVTRPDDDPPSPLYEIRSNDSLELDEISMDIGGSNNYYKNTNVVLQVSSDTSLAGALRYTFDDFSSTTRQPSWYNEQNPQPATLFSWSEPSRPVDEQTIATFIQPGTSEGPFSRVLQFVPTRLPDLPPLPPLDRQP
jgi:serine/threonine protein kinase